VLLLVQVGLVALLELEAVLLLLLERPDHR